MPTILYRIIRKGNFSLVSFFLQNCSSHYHFGIAIYPCSHSGATILGYMPRASQTAARHETSNVNNTTGGVHLLCARCID